MALTDDELRRIENAKVIEYSDVESLVAEVKRLRGVALPDAELGAIRLYTDRFKRHIQETGNIPVETRSWITDIAALLAHVAHRDTVIADLKTDLANENQWAAGFRACREMALGVFDRGVWYLPFHDVFPVAKVIDAIAALNPADYKEEPKP